MNYVAGKSYGSGGEADRGGGTSSKSISDHSGSGAHSQKKLKRSCFTVKNLAEVTWNIIRHNPIKVQTYQIFMILDILITGFFVLNIVQRVHYSNFSIDNIDMETLFNVNDSQPLTSTSGNHTRVLFPHKDNQTSPFYYEEGISSNLGFEAGLESNNNSDVSG